MNASSIIELLESCGILANDIPFDQAPDNRCTYNYLKKTIFLPDTESAEFVSNMNLVQFGKESKSIIYSLMRCKNIQISDDILLMFCILHEVKHYMDHRANGDDFFINYLLSDCSIKWLAATEDDRYYILVRDAATRLLDEQCIEECFPQNPDEEKAKEALLAFCYRFASHESSADCYAISQLKAYHEWVLRS